MRPGCETGASEALALSLLTPVMLVAALAVMWISRQVDTQAQVFTAAEASAQAAALQRSSDAAESAARSIAVEMLQRNDLCRDVVVQVDLSQFGPGGRVVVDISCEVSDVGLAALTATRTHLRAQSVAGIDTYKEIRSGWEVGRWAS